MNQIGHVPGLLNSGENPVPINLIQDSYRLMLNSLPDDQKNVIEDLKNTIDYQINFFELTDKRGSKLKLTCKLCKDILHIANVETHVKDQKHLHIMMKRCKETGETGHSASISVKEREYLDFDEVSQAYRCTLCNEKLASSSKAWTRHFNSSSHCSKLKSSKPNSVSNSVAVSRSVVNNNPKNNQAAITNQLRSIDKEIGQYLSDTLKGDIVNFKPIYKFDQLYFTCKVCNQNLRPENVERHAYTRAHLCYSKKNVSNTKVAPKNSNNAKSAPIRAPNSITVSSSAVNNNPTNNQAAMTNQLRSVDKEIGQYLSDTLKSDIVNFKPTYKFDELYFTCMVCNQNIRPENVERHAYTRAHLNNLKKNASNEKPLVAQKNSNNAKSAPTSASNSITVSSSAVNNPENNQVAMTNQLRSVDKDIAKNSNNAKPIATLLSFAQTDSAKIISDIVEDLNPLDKKIVEDFGEDSEKILNSFELSFKSFICKICRLSMFQKYAKAHFYNCTGVKDVRNSKCFVNVEDLNAENREIVKDLQNSSDELFFFQLHYKFVSNELGIFCCVCNFNLASKHVHHHIDAITHREKIRTNPFTLALESLNESNKQIVQGLTTVLRDRIKYFCLGYKIGTEDLRFYCKLCMEVLLPENVEDHVKLNGHQSRALKNLTVVDFQSLTGIEKEMLKDLPLKLNTELKYIDILRKGDSNKIYITCNVCNLTFKPEFLPGHFEYSSHIDNLNLRAIFNDFVSLERSVKYIIRDLYHTFGSKLNIFTLVLNKRPSKKLKLKCKLCDVIVSSNILNVEWLANHLRNENHPVIGSEGASNDRYNLVANRILHSNINPGTDNLEGSSKLFCPSDGISSPSAISSVHQTPSKELGIEYNMLTNDGNCKTCSIIPFNCDNCNNTVNFNAENFGGLRQNHREWLIVNCRKKSIRTLHSQETIPFNCDDCNNTVNFKAEEFGGLRQNHREWLIVNCQKKSIKTYLRSQEKQEISNCDVPDSMVPVMSVDNDNMRNVEANSTELFSVVSNTSNIPVKSQSGALSESDKETMRMLINKIGIKIKDFDFVFSAVTSQLCLKCKFCGVSICPETVENHLNNGAHIKCSKLGKSTNFELESLNDSNKEVGRQIFSQIGSKINDYNVDTTLFFVCEVCGANLYPDSIKNHMCEEHLKKFLSPDSQGNANLGSGAVMEESRIQSTASSTNLAEFGTDVLNNSGSNMAEYRCPACDKLVHGTSLLVHVNSNEHTIAVQQQLNGEWDTENARIFNEKIIGMLTGNMFIPERRVFLNLMEIFYNESDYNLWFLCRMCKVMICAESFLNHWGQLHRFAEYDKSQGSQTSSKIYNKDTLGLKIDTTGFQLGKRFRCRICNYPTTLKSVLDHCNSPQHIHFLTWGDHPIRFTSFLDYKSRVLKVFSRSDRIILHDFDLFCNTESPKLHVYCSSCRELLRPESLHSHVEMRKHRENSALRILKETRETAESPLNFEEISRCEILDKPGEIFQSASPNRFKKISKNSSDSCLVM